jgi:hypothetical protein
VALTSRRSSPASPRSAPLRSRDSIRFTIGQMVAHQRSSAYRVINCAIIRTPARGAVRHSFGRRLPVDMRALASWLSPFPGSALEIRPARVRDVHSDVGMRANLIA